MNRLAPFESGPARRLFESLIPTDRPAFIDPAWTVDWECWIESVGRLRGELGPLRDCRVGLPVRPNAAVYAILTALGTLGVDICLLDARWTEDTLARLNILDGLDAVVDIPDLRGPDGFAIRELRTTGRGSGRGVITIYTSGSTGLPKAVAHDWNSLTRPVRRGGASRNQRWLLTYRPQLYAGLQVFFQALLQQGTLVLPEPEASPGELVDLMGRAAVTAVSATPSYWRRLLMHVGLPRLNALNLEQITLGGEVTDQTLLDSLKRAFPAARIVHIYATSELGRCFSVKDGLEGFPASFLENCSEDGVSLKVEDGELLARSLNGDLTARPPSSTGDPKAGGWVATGDLVQPRGDRYVFIGRKSDIINVGGNKVQPLRVEQLILTIPGVRDVRVFPRKSSLVGQMVACEFVVRDGPAAVEREIGRVCREALSSHEVPRFVTAVSTIGLSVAGKKLRGSHAEH